MAIIKKFNADDNAPGGAPVVSSAGAGRMRPAAGGVSPTQSMGGSSQKAGGGPGFVNISRMFNTDKTTGQNMGNKIAGGFNARGQEIESDVNGMKQGFGAQLEDEKKKSGVGANTVEAGWWNGSDSPDMGLKSEDNKPYADHKWGGAANLQEFDQKGYDNATTRSQNLQKRVEGLGTDGGRQSEIQSAYQSNGQNMSHYGSAYDSALMGNSVPDQTNALQAKFGNIYGTLTDANKASVAQGDDARKIGQASIDYHQGQVVAKDRMKEESRVAQEKIDKENSDRVWAQNTSKIYKGYDAEVPQGRPTGESILNNAPDLAKYGFPGAYGSTFGSRISGYSGIPQDKLQKLFDTVSDAELQKLMSMADPKFNNGGGKDFFDYLKGLSNLYKGRY